MLLCYKYLLILKYYNNCLENINKKRYINNYSILFYKY